MTTVASSSAFVYVASRPGGGRRVGVRQAPGQAQLAKSLRAENQLLVKSWRLPAWAAPSPSQAVSLKDQASLNEQLGQLLSRGVPLVEALDVVSQTVRPVARPRMLKLRELVQSGSSFADACKAAGGFDAVTIAVYRAAERTGDLAGAAKELATTARRRLSVSDKAITLMIYPAIIMFIAVNVVFLMMLFIVPTMGEALKKNDIPLPWVSAIIIDCGLFMRAHVGWVLAGLGLLIVAIIVLRRTVMSGVHLFMRKLPAVRDVVLAQESARFFSVMAAMTRTGIPLADALGVSNQAITHPQMRKQLDRLRTRLIEGGLLRTLIDEVTTLPLSTRRLLIAAERSGDMESAFGTLAGDMSDLVDKSSQRVLAALEPVLIIVMFLIIGGMLLALMLPMLTMTSKIQL